MLLSTAILYQINGRKKGRKEGSVLFNNTHNTFYTVIWCRTYGKEPFSERPFVQTHRTHVIYQLLTVERDQGARCSSVVRAFAHGAMGCRIDPSWGGPIELFLVPASAPRL